MIIQRGPNVHHDTRNIAAVSDTARPERITASTTWSRSRPVDRARRGTWVVELENEGRGHVRSSQCKRYFNQRTSTAPATAMSPIRWTRSSFRLVATTPQVGQPSGWSVSIMIRRLPPSGTVAEMTRQSGGLKMLGTASEPTPVGSVKSRGPVPVECQTHSSQQGHGPFCHLRHGINSPPTTKRQLSTPEPMNA
jgi:hypothetical protein